MKQNKSVMVFYNDDLSPLCGSDGTFITELKTVKGIINRIKKHMEFLTKHYGIHKYIVIPYYQWYQFNTCELMERTREGRYTIHNF